MGLVAWERRLRRQHDIPPVDRASWAKARIYNLWFDHSALRLIWTNQHEIAPGVFRSNNPTPGRLKRLKSDGIKSVLTLRGGSETAHYLTEKAYCAELGLAFHSIGFSDKQAPPAAGLLALIDLFRRIEKPFVMHCKSGADRAGLASVIYLLVIEGRPLDEAQKMLSPRFLHFKGSKTGILDRVFDAYRAEGRGRSFEDWLRDGYVPEAI